MAKNDEQQNANGDGGTAEVAQAVEESDAKGYIGQVTDPTPNENYTVQGRASGSPVPETDPDLARQAREASYGQG